MSFTYDKAQEFLDLSKSIEDTTSMMYDLMSNVDITNTQRLTIWDALRKIDTQPLRDMFCSTIGHIVDENWDGYSYCSICDKPLPNNAPKTLVTNSFRLKSTLTDLEGESAVDTPAPTPQESNPSK